MKQSKCSEEQIVYAIRQAITVDHGTEFQSRALEDWACRRGVQLDFIHRVNPWKMPSLNRLTAACGTSVGPYTNSPHWPRRRPSLKRGGSTIISAGPIAYSAT